MKKDKMAVIVYGAKKQTLKINPDEEKLTMVQKWMKKNIKKRTGSEMNVEYPYEAKIHIAIFYTLEKS